MVWDSCFQAIMQIVDNFVKFDANIEIAILCYRIIYELCKAPSTSPFVMAHLRDHFDSGESVALLAFGTFTWKHYFRRIIFRALSDLQPNIDAVKTFCAGFYLVWP